MPFGMAGSIIGGGKQASAAKSAAQTQASAANHATDIQNAQFIQQQQNQQPWRDAGQNALGQLQTQLPDLTQGFDPSKYGVSPTFSYNPSDFANDPAFKSAMDMGQQAMERSAAAKGSVLGGAAIKAAQAFGADTANQFYNQDRAAAQNTYQQNYSNAFNTFQNNQSNAFNKLASVAGVGQTAVNQLGQAGQNYANAAASNALAAGNAGSAGIIGAANGAANAWGGAAGSLSSMAQNGQNPFSSSYWKGLGQSFGMGGGSSANSSGYSTGSGSSASSVDDWAD